MDLHPVSLEDIVALRRAKVDALRVRSFSWAHERAAAAGRAFRLREGHAEIGYALVADEARLIEFAVDSAWRGRTLEAFEAVVAQLSVRQIEVRTDDGLAFEAALAFASKQRWDARPAGPIYALETGVLRRPPKPEGAEVKALAADQAGAAVALFAEDSAIEPPLRDAEAVARAATAEMLWGLLRDGALVGAALGVALPMHRFVAIRPAIRAEHRRKGLATYLVGEVSHALLLANRRLIAEAEALDRGPRRIAEHLGLTLAAHQMRARKL
jgi:hypothetical protein